MNLYKDALPELEDGFRKMAGFATRLSETPENWPQELTSELFKQLPFLSDYDVNVNLDRVEPNRGFAFGYADVANKTERPEIEHQETGLPHIRIPLVIMERAAKPFSVFMDGEKVMPLTEERIRETLFNPATFDISTSAPRDPSLVEATMPPQRSGIGMGGEYKMASADFNKLSPEEQFVYKAQMEKEAVSKEWISKRVASGMSKAKDPLKRASRLSHKMQGISDKAGNSNKSVDAFMKVHEKTEHAASEGWKNVKKASILMAIAPTISERDVERFTEKVANDQTLIAGFKRSGIAPILVEAFENTKRASAEDRLDALADAVQPTVVTFQKLPGGDFLVKSANVNAFIEKTAAGEVVPGQEVGQAIGQEQAQGMQPGQTATAVSQPVEEEAVEPVAPSKAKPVEEFGQYKVQDSMGNSIMGHVFPTTLSWDGSFSEQPIALFTNGSAYAMQDSIAGELVGKGTNLPDDEPRGDGAFYCVEGGDAKATGPLTIGSSAAGPDGLPHLQATDAFGNQLQIIQMEGMTAPQRISDVEMAIPSTWKFMRLNNQTQLAGSADQMGKDQAVKQASASATLFFNGSFNLVGGCGLEKISADLRQDLDHVSAEFMLGVLGVDGATAKMKVAEARRKGQVKLAGLKTITTMGERYATSTKTASALMKKMPDLRRDLTKEAAAMKDEGTVDAILSLNFINPENLSTFIGYIPELEEVAEKLAEMLLFAFLGMKELPEGAIESAMKGLEDVLVGLKSLAQTEG